MNSGVSGIPHSTVMQCRHCSKLSGMGADIFTAVDDVRILRLAQAHYHELRREFAGEPTGD